MNISIFFVLKFIEISFLVYELFQLLRCGMTPIADVHNFKIIKGSMKILTNHTILFSKQLLSIPKEFFALIFQLLNLSNRETKETASDLMQAFIKQVFIRKKLDFSFRNSGILSFFFFFNFK
jgi:hypothetical protein